MNLLTRISKRRKKQEKGKKKEKAKLEIKKKESSSSDKELVSVSENDDDPNKEPLIVEDPLPEKTTKSKLKASLSKSRKPIQPDEIIEMADISNETDLAELVAMGFDKDKASAAILAYPNNKEGAVNFLISNE